MRVSVASHQHYELRRSREIFVKPNEIIVEETMSESENYSNHSGGMKR